MSGLLNHTEELLSTVACAAGLRWVTLDEPAWPVPGGKSVRSRRAGGLSWTVVHAFDRERCTMGRDGRGHLFL